MPALLEVQGLTVEYRPRLHPPLTAVDDVSFTLADGEFVGLIGESGSGKTTLGTAVLQLLKPPAHVTGGAIRFDGKDLTELTPEGLREVRWRDLSTVFQSSMNSLNPVVRIQTIFTDVMRAHTDWPQAKIRNRSVELLEMVQIDPRFLDAYPHELSGGMRQRVNLALALALEPRLVLLDEPTTGLDVLVQRRILDNIRDLQRQQGFAVLFVSHDLGTVLETSDRIMIMYDGKIVETATTVELLAGPKHPYAQELLGSYLETFNETQHDPPPAEQRKTIIEVIGVRRQYSRRQGLRSTPVIAVDDVSFSLAAGEVTALVGQSGSGKSTLAKLITGIEKPSGGSVRFHGEHEVTEVARLRGAGMREFRRAVQYVFQDPYAALNPARTVGYYLTRPIRNFGGADRTRLRGAAVTERALELLQAVGLTPPERYLGRFPFELSGGQRQRVVIARALASNPKLLIADEPIASLDVSIRAEILELLNSLVDTHGVGILYITHDLLSAKMLSDHALVLNEGRLVESGPAADVINNPKDPYTRKLLDAIPQPSHRKDVSASLGS
ncbi:ABC transporter ATP-binding protein [Microlunatus parietis]|uniref:Peptide/nickel transport system ATP-binding protein n=1 Tax=Microlunatus parietis TaxID=682979 RepID=A0A7Y9I721_9ACTN|nr:ABC transporter ATP-binding protein [Microlunatus parietis]NYE71337.1 peptide/nickel transport system ATP-binding protein [Microlunatus parietis]